MSPDKNKTDTRLRHRELNSLLELMQDRDEVTQELVRNRIFTLGWPALDYCFRHQNRVVPQEGRRDVALFLRDTSSIYGVRQILDLMLTGDTFFVPDGLYYLTRILMPSLTPEEFSSCYAGPACDLVSELRDTMTAVEKVEMLNYIVFDRCSFRLSSGYRDGYEDVVLIPDIMERRQAGVVGLSAVYFLLASYAGLPVYPVFPREPGYYVAYFEDGRTLFSMDMGQKGRISDPIPAASWLDTGIMGKDQTILYLYATALRRFGDRPLSRLHRLLLDRIIDVVKL